jgi:hypothetical protein
MFRLSSRLPVAVLLGALSTRYAYAQPPDANQSPAPGRAAEAASTSNAEVKRPQLVTWAGYAQSDNVTRTLDAERGSYGDVGVLFNAAQESARLNGSIQSNIEFRSYSLEGIDDETLGTLDANADFNVARDVFHWLFRETYDQGRTDAFAPVGPANRENINVFSSGPRLDLPVGQRTTVALGGNYSYRRYQDSQYVDSDAVIYDLGVFRQVNPTTQLGMVATANDIDYIDTAISPYEIDTLKLRYAKTLATGAVLAELGQNELSSQGLATDEPLFNFQWFRDVGARGTLSITASRVFTDSGGLAAPTQSDAPPPAESDVLLSTDPLERKSLGVGYSINTPRTNVSIRVTATDDRYFGSSTLDNEGIATGLSISRSVSPRLRFGLAIDSLSREFTDTGFAPQDDEDRTTSAWVDRTLGRRLSVSLSLTRYERQGTASFNEDRYEVRFSYSPTGRADAALPFAGR